MCQQANPTKGLVHDFQPGSFPVVLNTKPASALFFFGIIRLTTQVVNDLFPAQHSCYATCPWYKQIRISG